MICEHCGNNSSSTDGYCEYCGRKLIKKPVQDPVEKPKGLFGPKPVPKPEVPTGSKPETPTGQKPVPPTGQKPETPTGPKPVNPTGPKPVFPTGTKPLTPPVREPGGGTGGNSMPEFRRNRDVTKDTGKVGGGTKGPGGGTKGPGGTEDPDKNKKLVIALLALVSCVLVVVILSSIFKKPTPGPGSTPVAEGTTQTEPDQTEPEAEPEAEAEEEAEAEPEPEPEPEAQAEPDRMAILYEDSDYQAFNPYSGSDRVGYITLDISTGNVVGYNYEEPLSSSALISIPILYTLAVQADSGEIDLEEKIKFRYSVGGRGKLTKSDDGKKVSVLTLAQYMMLYSDNNATNTLIDYLGMTNISSTCKDKGYESVSVGGKIMKTDDYTSNDNYVSALDAARMLADLYRDQYSSIGKGFLNSYMEIQDSSGRDGLGRHISGATFLNMNGLKEKKYNEIAIIDDGSQPYINVVMSSGEEFETLRDYAAEYGRIVDSVLSE